MKASQSITTIISSLLGIFRYNNAKNNHHNSIKNKKKYVKSSGTI